MNRRSTLTVAEHGECHVQSNEIMIRCGLDSPKTKGLGSPPKN